MCRVIARSRMLLRRTARERTSFALPSSERSLHSDRDGVARAANVGQSHRHRVSRHDAARYPHVDLVVARITGWSEIKDLRGTPADGYLRRNHAAVYQAGGVHGQDLSGNGGIAGGSGLSGL